MKHSEEIGESYPPPLHKYNAESIIEEHRQNNFMTLRGRMRRLPAIHQATLRALIEHLARVVANSERNKMDPKNLAIVFGTVIFGEDDLPKGNDLLLVQSTKVRETVVYSSPSNMSFQDTLMEDMITHADVLFDERAAPPAPPKPPSPPTIETSTNTGPSTREASPDKRPDPQPQSSTDSDYKAHYRRISESLLRSPEISPHAQDFTPELPPRPGNSIHPSHRSANSSSRTTDSDETSTSESPPPLPARQVERRSLETRALHASEGSASGSQASPTSDHHHEDSGGEGTALTTPSVVPSSPTSVRSPMALQSDLSQEGDSSLEVNKSHEHEK